MLPLSGEPAWAPGARRSAYTVGVEEEVMLLDPGDWALAQASTRCSPRLPGATCADASVLRDAPRGASS